MMFSAASQPGVGLSLLIGVGFCCLCLSVSSAHPSLTQLLNAGQSRALGLGERGPSLHCA